MSRKTRRKSGHRHKYEEDSGTPDEESVSLHQEALYEEEEETPTSTRHFIGEESLKNPSYLAAVAACNVRPYKIPKFEKLKPYLQKALREGELLKIRKVFICGCEAPSSRTSWTRSVLRWTISWITDIHHVEFVFQQEGDPVSKFLACTVDFNSPVSIDKLDPNGTDYKSAFWDVYAVKLTEEQKIAIFIFCLWQLNKPMNSNGVYANFLSWGLFAGSTPKDCDEDNWFCSQLIAAALKWVGVPQMKDIEPRTTTPGELCKILRSEGSLFDRTDDHSLVPEDAYEV